MYMYISIFIRNILKITLFSLGLSLFLYPNRSDVVLFSRKLFRWVHNKKVNGKKKTHATINNPTDTKILIRK